MNKSFLIGLIFCVTHMQVAAFQERPAQMNGAWDCRNEVKQNNGTLLAFGDSTMKIQPNGTADTEIMLSLPLQGYTFRYHTKMVEKWWVEGNMEHTIITHSDIQRAHDAQLNQQLQADASLRNFEENLYQKGFVDSNQKAIQEQRVRTYRIIELSDSKLILEIKENNTIGTSTCNKKSAIKNV